MKSLLKKCILSTAALAAGTLPGFAAVTATVPFDFTAGPARLPAGVYKFEGTDAGLLTITGGARRTVSFVVGVVNGPVSGSSGLKFEKVGGEYRLARIATADEATRELTPLHHKRN